MGGEGRSPTGFAFLETRLMFSNHLIWRSAARFAQNHGSVHPLHQIFLSLKAMGLNEDGPLTPGNACRLLHALDPRPPVRRTIPIAIVDGQGWYQTGASQTHTRLRLRRRLRPPPMSFCVRQFPLSCKT